MAPEDEKKTIFVIKKEVYYYKVMPFRLKYIEATYQQVVNKMFKE